MNKYQQIETAVEMYLNDKEKLYPNQSPQISTSFKEWAGIDLIQFMSLLDVNSLKHDSENFTIKETLPHIRIYTELIRKGGPAFETGEITYGFAQSPFGEIIVGSTHQGVCCFSFSNEDHDKALKRVVDQWQPSHLTRDDKAAKIVVDNLFSSENKLPDIHMRGSELQIKVWQALLLIPFGHVTTYGSVARIIHNEKAVRAVATAVGQNPIAIVVPCHRVVRSEGILGNYYWGTPKKACILGWERAKVCK